MVKRENISKNGVLKSKTQKMSQPQQLNKLVLNGINFYKPNNSTTTNIEGFSLRLPLPVIKPTKTTNIISKIHGNKERERERGKTTEKHPVKVSLLFRIPSDISLSLSLSLSLSPVIFL